MIASEDPDLRKGALTIINTARAMLPFVFLVAMLVIGIPVQVLAGARAGPHRRRHLRGRGLLLSCRLCYVLRRWYWFLPKARRRLCAGDRAGYEEYRRRSLPRNSSVVFQSVVGILTVIIAI
jgi:hypothetical protein